MKRLIFIFLVAILAGCGVESVDGPKLSCERVPTDGVSLSFVCEDSLRVSLWLSGEKVDSIRTERRSDGGRHVVSVLWKKSPKCTYVLGHYGISRMDEDYDNHGILMKRDMNCSGESPLDMWRNLSRKYTFP
jgi:hypothetical protein